MRRGDHLARRPDPPRLTSLLRERCAGQSGVSLVELLVVLALLIVVFGTILVPLTTAQHNVNTTQSYAFAQQGARTGLDSMVRQIRQAYAVLSATPNTVEINITIGGVSRHVYYDCTVAQPNSSFQECVRLQAAAGSPLPALSTGAVVVQNLTNGTAADPIFTFTPDTIAPEYLTATVKVPASGGATRGFGHTIVLSDGASLTNLSYGN